MASENEILGISGHLDITDIEKSLNEMINNLDKIGIKTDVLSKQMSDAMQSIANSTDDSATKQKRAMEVLAKATEEAKLALSNYPEQIRLAKEAMSQTEVATQNLEKELAKLNTQLQSTATGSEKYDELKKSISGVELQIHNNTSAFQAQQSVVQEMEAGYNGLVSMLGFANASTAANAVAHGAVTAAVSVEAAAHANNAAQLQNEANAQSVAVDINRDYLQTEEEITAYLKQREAEFIALRDSGAQLNKVLQEQGSFLATIGMYGRNKEDYDTALPQTQPNTQAVENSTAATEKATQANIAHKRSIEEVQAELQSAQTEYKKMIGLSENAGKLRTLFQENLISSQYSKGIISDAELSKIIEAKSRVEQLKTELSQLKTENTEIVPSSEISKTENLLSELSARYEDLYRKKEALESKGEISTKDAKQINEYNEKLKSLGAQLEQTREKAKQLREQTFFGRQRENIDNIKDSLKSVGNGISELVQKIPGVQSLENGIKKIGDAVSQTKSKIADSSAVNRMSAEFTQAKGILADFSSKVGNVLTGNGKLQQSFGDIKTALGGMLAPLTGVTSGALAATKALWSMAMTPIGAVISAIVIAFKALHTWMTKSAEGQRAFAKISAYLGSLLASFTDIVVKFGSYLYHAFADAGAPMNAFAKSFVTTFKTAIQTVIGMVSGLGNTIKGIFTADWDMFKQGISQVWEAGKNGVKTALGALETSWKAFQGLTKMASDGISTINGTDALKTLKEINAKMKESGNLALQQLDAEKQLSEAKVKEHQLDVAIAEEREKIYTLTGKEKDAQIEKVKNMLKEKYEPQVAAQQTLLDIQRKRNALHTVSLEQLKQEREAQGAVYAIQAQQASSTRMLTRMQQANIKSMANASKKDARQEQKIKDADARYKEIETTNALARAKEQQDLQDMITDATIAAMQEGSAKVLAERDRELEKELEKLEERRVALVKAEKKRQKAEFEATQKKIEERGGKRKSWSKEEIDQTAIDKINAQMNTVKNLTVQRQQNDQRRQELESMREYLRQYGDAEQQKLAITEEYEKKINDAIGANDPYKAASLMEERDKRLQDIGTKDVFKDIDWEGVFENLEGHSTQYLEALRSKLQAILQSGKVTDITQIESLQSKINDINALIAQQPSLFKFVSEAQIEHNRRIQEAVDAQERLNVAKQKEVEEAQALAEVQNQVFNSEQWKAFGNKDLKAGELNTEVARQTLDNIGKTKGINSPEYTEFAKIISTLIAAEGKLRKAREDVAKATDKATDAEDGAKETGRGKWNRIRSDIENSAAYANVSAAPELLNSLGFGEAAEQATKGLQGFNDGMNAVTDFMSGNYIGALQKGISAITNLGESFGLWSNSNVAEKEAEIEERQNANKELVKALKDLTDAFKNSDLANGIKTFQQAQGVLQTQIRNAQEAADAKGDEYSGHHSTNYYSGEFGRQMRELYKRTFGTTADLRDGGQNYDDYVYIDPAKLREMRMFDPEAWANAIGALRNADKNKFGVADMFVSLVDDFGTAMEDLERQWKETLTNLSWDSLKSSFASTLKDMSKKLKDWNNDVDDILRSSVSNFVASQYTSTGADGKPKGRVTEWYDKLAKYMQGEEGTSNKPNLDATEAADLRTEWIGITRDANAEVEKLYEMLDLDDVSSSEAQGTINGIKSISDDTGNEIVGRLTAMQISVERNSIILEEQLEQQGAQVTSLQSIEAYTANINGNVVNITENVRTIVESQNAMNMHLANISANTEVLPGMYREITRMRTKIDTL